MTYIYLTCIFVSSDIKKKTKNVKNQTKETHNKRRTHQGTLDQQQFFSSPISKQQQKVIYKKVDLKGLIELQCNRRGC